MRSWPTRIGFLFLLLVLRPGPAQGQEGWVLVWNEEFDGPAIDPSVWGHEIGFIRNNELQYYTERSENARSEGGNLVIEARQDDWNGNEYTSASINTKGKKSWKYGRIEMRAKLPFGKGIWPAFWTLGDSSRWPACGEIDIMELIGGGEGYDDKIYGTIHWDDGGHKSSGSTTQLAAGVFADDYHTFGIEWDSERIRWFLDGTEFFSAAVTNAAMSEFHQNHYLLLNLAVGGDWPGSPNASTVFPQKYFVDWVRVYQLGSIDGGSEDGKSSDGGEVLDAGDALSEREAGADRFDEEESDLASVEAADAEAGDTKDRAGLTSTGCECGSTSGRVELIAIAALVLGRRRGRK